MIKKNFNRLGFSLAEMLIVMLVLTVVLAASMPIISKRATQPVTNVTSTSGGIKFVQCSTDSDISEKVVSLPGTILDEGLSLLVNFEKANTASDISLKLNNEKAYPIVNLNGNVISFDNNAGENTLLTFDKKNQRWVLLSPSSFSVAKSWVPDYSSGKSITWGQVYKADTDGWLSVILSGSYLNGMAVYVGLTSTPTAMVGHFGDDINNYTKAASVMVPIPKNYYYLVKTVSVGASSGYGYENTTVTFYKNRED